jgi:hypothetical protein
MPPNFIYCWNGVDTSHWLSGRMEPRVTQEDCHYWNDRNRVFLFSLESIRLKLFEEASKQLNWHDGECLTIVAAWSNELTMKLTGGH